MIVGFQKAFDKQFKLLPPTHKNRSKEALLLFQADSLHPSLRNHPLKGEWIQYRSISAGGDLRLHYRIINENVVIFVAVGSHSRLYK